LDFSAGEPFWGPKPRFGYRLDWVTASLHGGTFWEFLSFLGFRLGHTLTSTHGSEGRQNGIKRGLLRAFLDGGGPMGFHRVPVDRGGPGRSKKSSTKKKMDVHDCFKGRAGRFSFQTRGGRGPCLGNGFGDTWVGHSVHGRQIGGDRRFGGAGDLGGPCWPFPADLPVWGHNRGGARFLG